MHGNCKKKTRTHTHRDRQIDTHTHIHTNMNVHKDTIKSGAAVPHESLHLVLLDREICVCARVLVWNMSWFVLRGAQVGCCFDRRALNTSHFLGKGKHTESKQTSECMHRVMPFHPLFLFLQTQTHSHGRYMHLICISKCTTYNSLNTP